MSDFREGHEHASDTIQHQDEIEALIDAHLAGGASETAITGLVDDYFTSDATKAAITTLVNTRLAAASTQVAVTDIAALTGGEPPTEGEFNALAVRVNVLTQVLRDAGLIPSS